MNHPYTGILRPFSGRDAFGLSQVRRVWKENIPDGGFDDASKWEIVGFGGSIIDSTLEFILATVIRAAPLPLVPSVAGRTYRYTLDIGAHTDFGITRRALWGGVEFWDYTMGIGIFTGEITAINANGLVFQANSGQYTVNSISILSKE